MAIKEKVQKNEEKGQKRAPYTDKFSIGNKQLSFLNLKNSKKQRDRYVYASTHCGPFYIIGVVHHPNHTFLQNYNSLKVSFIS